MWTRTLLSWIFGLAIGAVVGIVLVSFFSPVSGDELRENLKDHYRDARVAAHNAAKERRAELERELETMRQRA